MFDGEYVGVEMGCGLRRWDCEFEWRSVVVLEVFGRAFCLQVIDVWGAGG